MFPFPVTYGSVCDVYQASLISVEFCRKKNPFYSNQRIELVLNQEMERIRKYVIYSVPIYCSLCIDIQVEWRLLRLSWHHGTEISLTVQWY